MLRLTFHVSLLIGLIVCEEAVAQVQPYKKLKGFDANCDAAIALYLNEDDAGEAFSRYIDQAFDLHQSYRQSLQKKFDQKKDSVAFARGLLKVSWINFKLISNSDDPHLYEKGEKDLELARKYDPGVKAKTELLAVYNAKLYTDFREHPSRVDEDLFNIKTLAGEDSFLYLYKRSLAYAYNDRFLLVEATALKAKEKTRPFSPQVISANSLLAGLYNILGEQEKALKIAEQNLEVLVKSGRRYERDYFQASYQVANLYMRLSQWEKAKELYKQNLKDMSKDEKTWRYYDQSRIVFDNLYALSWLYHETGEVVKADSLFRIQKSIVDDFADKSDDLYFDDCSRLAEYYSEIRHDYDSAIIMEKRVLGFGKKAGLKEYEMESLGELSFLYRMRKDYTTADSLINSALAMAKELNCSPCIAANLARKAMIYEKTARLVEAEQLYVAALDTVRNKIGEGSEQYHRRKYMVGMFSLRTKQFQKAEPIFIKAVDSDVEKITKTFSGLTEMERESVSLNYYEGRFNDFNYFAIQRYSQNPVIAEKMYDVRLFTKGLLLNSASKWKQRIINSGDIRLLNEFNHWQKNKEMLMRLDNLGKEIRERQEINIDSLQLATVELERRLQQRSEFFARINDRKQFSWKDVQKHLHPGEAAIEMIRIEKNDSDEKSDSVYYAALIVTDQTKDHPEMIVLPNGQAMEKVGVYYRNCILSKTRDTLSYQYYWEKIGEFLRGKNVKTVIFSPDGVYNQISLNSLYNTKTKSYLINEFNIHLVTNTKDIVPLYQREEAYNNYAILMGYPNYQLGASERKSIAAASTNYLRSSYVLDMDVGGSIAPLEGTKVEVEEIGELLRTKGWQPEIFMGDKALEENIKMSFKPQILHLATHGFFQNSKQTRKRTNPLLSSGLLLAGAEMTLHKKTDQQSEDGVLTAYEAMNLNLENTQLVVLSACETGKGEIKNGEGVYGLQRAFMVAGARSIIMSLWKVDDEASQQLMTNFYTLWLNGASKREAFKQAQLQLRSHFPEPFYWSAFVMIGE